ncbi:hypothetical protein LSH36_1112g00075 [Paralvinella palmiformis]|uniref:ABC transporter domain-containing protein n=1 Tax=Paralvinella palmiformis TaxID=53620 RepID=A0AAD9IUY6_9ANNE|nr:hypothetical protein LSH36_1112g00075 [Paralvinella palmiformis]
MIHRTRNPSATEKTLLTGKAICRNSLSTTNVLNQINKARRSNHQDIKYHQVSNEIEAEYLNHKRRIREPKTLSWTNIKVNTRLTEKKFQWLFGHSLPEKEPTKIILNKVTGIAKAQSLLAIIGASGSGKTTLLNCLTNRNIGSLKVEGSILVNGANIGDDLYELSGYVQQDDIFIGILTVREHLWFNAVLNLSKTLKHCEKEELVEDIMKEMGLKKCENTFIGIPGISKGISGSERKCLAFAEKLLTKRPIMLCDEPTSGLDSSAACSVVEALRNMTNNGHTVLTTIHQPSSEVFAMLDEILIMANGRVAFMGSRNDALKFFCGLNYQCPQNYNTSDFFINTLAIIPGQEKESKEKILKICNSFDDSIYFERIEYQIQEQIKNHNANPILKVQELSKEASDRHKCQVSWWVQLQMCLWRSQIEIIRNRIFHLKFMYLLVRVCILPYILQFLSFVSGMVYGHQTYTQTGMKNINAIIYMLVSQLMFHLSFASLLNFQETFPTLAKDHYDGKYTVWVYYLASMLLEFSFAVFTTFVYLTIVYSMTGLYPEANAFFTMAAAIMLMGNLAVENGHICASMTFDPTVALILQQSSLFLQHSFPPIFKIIEDTSIYRYAFQIILISQWRNVQHLECEKSNRNRSLKDTSDIFLEEQTICYDNGIQVIESYGYQP